MSGKVISSTASPAGTTSKSSVVKPLVATEEQRKKIQMAELLRQFFSSGIVTAYFFPLLSLKERANLSASNKKIASFLSFTFLSLPYRGVSAVEDTRETITGITNIMKNSFEQNGVHYLNPERLYAAKTGQALQHALTTGATLSKVITLFASEDMLFTCGNTDPNIISQNTQYGVRQRNNRIDRNIDASGAGSNRLFTYTINDRTLLAWRIVNKKLTQEPGLKCINNTALPVSAFSSKLRIIHEERALVCAETVPLSTLLFCDLKLGKCCQIAKPYDGICNYIDTCNLSSNTFDLFCLGDLSSRFSTHYQLHYTQWNLDRLWSSPEATTVSASHTKYTRVDFDSVSRSTITAFAVHKVPTFESSQESFQDCTVMIAMAESLQELIAPSTNPADGVTVTRSCLHFFVVHPTLPIFEARKVAKCDLPFGCQAQSLTFFGSALYIGVAKDKRTAQTPTLPSALRYSMEIRIADTLFLQNSLIKNSTDPSIMHPSPNLSPPLTDIHTRNRISFAVNDGKPYPLSFTQGPVGIYVYGPQTDKLMLLCSFPPSTLRTSLSSTSSSSSPSLSTSSTSSSSSSSTSSSPAERKS